MLLLKSGFESGTITGLKARTIATVDEISRNLEKGTAKVTITFDIDQTITVSCGISDKSEIITLKSVETATIEF